MILKLSILEIDSKYYFSCWDQIIHSTYVLKESFQTMFYLFLILWSVSNPDYVLFISYFVVSIESLVKWENGIDVLVI